MFLNNFIWNATFKVIQLKVVSKKAKKERQKIVSITD